MLGITNSAMKSLGEYCPAGTPKTIDQCAFWLMHTHANNFSFAGGRRFVHSMVNKGKLLMDENEEITCPSNTN